MKYRILPIGVFLIATAIPVSAFELKHSQRDEQSLRMELEPVPEDRGQQSFDRYVQDLAAAARKDATPEERARKEDAVKEQQPKMLNPIALFRW
jgi:hypothetical protein